eukprot:2101126-Rhodomonas_salina.3
MPVPGCQYLYASTRMSIPTCFEVNQYPHASIHMPEPAFVPGHRVCSRALASVSQRAPLAVAPAGLQTQARAQYWADSLRKGEGRAKEDSSGQYEGGRRKIAVVSTREDIAGLTITAEAVGGEAEEEAAEVEASEGREGIGKREHRSVGHAHPERDCVRRERGRERARA